MVTSPAYEVLAQALKKEGIDTIFYLVGGPMGEATAACYRQGMRVIDVRHEQAASIMAHGYSRVRARPAVCIAAAGPGTANAASGIVNALLDRAPLLLIGGSSAILTRGWGTFQELDQVAMMRPITKWAGQVADPRRIPEMVHLALQYAVTDAPGPVYLDCPGDVIHQNVDPASLPQESWPPLSYRVAADPMVVQEAVRMLKTAQRPIIIGGSGVLWSEASLVFHKLVEATGIPFFTTPQARGIIPEDHRLCFLAARSTAFQEADVVLVVGARDNYALAHLQPPRFSRNARLIVASVVPTDIGRTRPIACGVLGDPAAVLEQLIAEVDKTPKYKCPEEWVNKLKQRDAAAKEKADAAMNTDRIPIHPLRLCKEVRDFLDRDAILVVDGQEILNFARQTIPTFRPGHRLNSGTAGWMGVGVPLGIGAKAAKPDKQVVVLTGDGAFGFNALEIDTALRQQLPVIIVISNNGGWTGRREGERKVGRDLGFSNYHRLADVFGGHGELVERPEDIRPALERARASGRVAIVNVITDPKAAAMTVKFTDYEYA